MASEESFLSGRAKALPLKFSQGNVGLVLFFTLFSLYTLSLAPSIYTGDSSLLAAASFSLGTAHPPGYPLYILLGKLFTFLPFGNVAFKVNLVNAAFGALACLMVFKASIELTGSRTSSWAAAMICGLVPLFFLESVKAEVYTLNAFLSTAIFYLGLRVLKGGDLTQNTLAALFLIGLGMGGHHTVGLMGIALLWPVALRWRDVSLRWLLLAPIFFTAGFSVNLLIYLRSLAFFGHGGLILYSDAGGTWQGLLRVLLRKAYSGGDTAGALGGLAAAGTGNAWFTGLKNSITLVALPAILPVAPLPVIGLFGLIKKKRVLAYFIITLSLWLVALSRLALSSPVVSADLLQTVSPYFLPVLPVLYCAAALGFAYIVSFLEKRRLDIIPKFVPYALAALPFVLLPFTIREASLSQNWIAYDYGRDLLTTLPRKSLLLNYADNPMFTVFYMRAVDRYREDIIAMNTAGTKDVYGIESSPGWKYSALYPEFYRAEKSSLRDIDRDFSLKGKLFANSPERMTRIISGHYSYYPYLLAVSLYPSERLQGGRAKTVADAAFRANYPKLNYERIVESPYQPDLLSGELYALYGFSSMFYGDLLKRGGEVGAGEAFRKMAFEISDPRMFLWPYINFLLGEGREQEAFGLIEKVGAMPGYEEFAGKLKQRALSSVGAGTEDMLK